MAEGFGGVAFEASSRRHTLQHREPSLIPTATRSCAPRLGTRPDRERALGDSPGGRRIDSGGAEPHASRRWGRPPLVALFVPSPIRSDATVRFDTRSSTWRHPRRGPEAVLAVDATASSRTRIRPSSGLLGYAAKRRSTSPSRHTCGIRRSSTASPRYSDPAPSPSSTTSIYGARTRPSLGVSVSASGLRSARRRPGRRGGGAARRDRAAGGSTPSSRARTPSSSTTSTPSPTTYALRWCRCSVSRGCCARTTATGSTTRRHFLDRIEQAGRTMETLTNDLLELSRIGERSERKALVDPLRVLSIVQAELKPRLEEQAVALVAPRERAARALRPDPSLSGLREPASATRSTTWAPCRPAHHDRRGEERPDAPRDLGRGQRPRDRARPPRADLRDLPEPRPPRGRAPRHRRGSRHRAEDRRDPRRPRLGREPPRRGARPSASRSPAR